MRSRKEGLASLALVLLVAHATHALEPGASRRLSDVEGVPLCTESCGSYPCRFCNTNGCCSSDDRSSYCRGEPRCRGTAGSSAPPAPPPAPNNNLATGLIGGGIFIVTVPTLALLLLLVYCQKKQDRRRQEARAAAAAAAAANAAVELQVPVAPASVAVGVAVPPVAVGVAMVKASSSSYNI